jgi:hypothetical protein
MVAFGNIVHDAAHAIAGHCHIISTAILAGRWQVLTMTTRFAPDRVVCKCCEVGNSLWLNQGETLSKRLQALKKFKRMFAYLSV